MGKEKEAIAEIIEYLKYEIEELEQIKENIQVPVCEKIKDDIFFILNYLKKKCLVIVNRE
jgi:hypothetical protein